MIDSLQNKITKQSILNTMSQTTDLSDIGNSIIYTFDYDNLFNDSICLNPNKEEFYPIQNITNKNLTICNYKAESKDIYGPYSIKHTETITEQSLSENKILYTPLKTTWLDFTSVVLFIYFILILAFTRNLLKSLPSLLISPQKAHNQFETNSQSYSYSRKLYFTPSLIIFSMYLLFLGNYLELFPKDIGLFEILIYISAVIMAIALIKQAALSIIGYVTMSNNFILELSFNRQLIFITSSIFLFPIVILLSLYHEPHHHKILLIIGISIISLLILYMIIRTFILFSYSRVSLFLWILYLCILEVSPYLAFYIIFQ